MERFCANLNMVKDILSWRRKVGQDAVTGDSKRYLE